MNDNTTPKTINEKELETLASWQEKKIFEKSLETPAGDIPKGDFSFYDGPPFATGLPHMGHILAGTIKDAIPRYQTMKGNSVRRVWGWDCHGLPIENLIEKKLELASKKDIEEYGIGKFNHEAQASVLQYDAEWKNIVPRLGRWVDMEHPYKTMDSTYTESIWWAWKELYTKGLAYEGNKMMHICPRCETPLAQSEVGLEYHDVTDLSVTAEFELVDEPGTCVLAWTTTPWTLPGNVALAVHNTIEYVKVKSSFEGKDNYFILAKKKVEEYFKESDAITIVEEFTGDKLVGKTYKPVFPYFIDKEIENKENIWKIWHADFITDTDGTGIAHEAPAFGAEDMELAKANKIPVIKHVKMDGTFIDAVTDFAGMKVKKKDDTQSADIEVIKWLAHNGKLFEKHKIIHSYPLCWRCSTPLLNYATSSWFVDVPKLKAKLLAENAKIGWTPAHVRDGRFGKWLEGAREWAVSRTRYWGAPLPVWKSEDGDIKVIGSLKELAALRKDKPKNTYYVMRHGQSWSNVNNVLDKGTNPDNHLTEEGMSQATDAALSIKDKGIDIIIASPVLRGKETAEIVGGILGIKVDFDEHLREYDMGIYDGKTRDEYFKSLPGSFVAYDTRVEGGETHEEMMHRSMAAVYDLEKKHEGKNILIVTHGGPARMLFAGAALITEEELIHDDEKEGAKLYPGNAEVRKLELSLVPRDETGAVNLHRPYIDEVVLEIDGKEYKRIVDVFDCWYESGSMPFAQLHYPFENKELFDKNFPADFIAEGMDQTRGWFYSLINLSVGLFGKAPYKHVIVNGTVLAEGGEKMSKSKKNYTDPLELVEKFGVDAVRYFLLSSPVIKGESVEFVDKSVEEVYKKVIQRLENVLSLYEMNKKSVVVNYSIGENVLDRWILSRIHELVKDATIGYDTYMLDEATRGVDQFVDDLSVWYIRRTRGALKGDSGEDVQKSTYGVLRYVLETFAKVVAPVMPFVAERIYTTIGGEKESVHLESWPTGGVIESEVIAEMKKTRELVSLGLMKRTALKLNVKQPLLSVTFKESLTKDYLPLVEDELNVKEVKHDAGQVEDVTLDTTITEELQKEGDLRKLMRAIQDARKEAGLVPSDDIVLIVSKELDLGDLSQLHSVCKVKEIKVDTSLSAQSLEISSGSLDLLITKN
ncbi:MAG: class I tRNA ligase family protein [Candidatus Pacebacteria bacterium]|nr:class I tRNA ligase family protein [Candidatus Paceibacterota bacterium]